MRTSLYLAVPATPRAQKLASHLGWEKKREVAQSEEEKPTMHSSLSLPPQATSLNHNTDGEDLLLKTMCNFH